MKSLMKLKTEFDKKLKNVINEVGENPKLRNKILWKYFSILYEYESGI